MKILILNGPNMNLLGMRQPEIYGQKTYADLCEMIRKRADACGVEVSFFQSNHEGDLIDRIQTAAGEYDGIVFNPAAYTHTSVALYDALTAVSVPTAEVHISDPDAREPFRKTDYIRPACCHYTAGHGLAGYCEALEALIGILRGSEADV